MQRDVFYGLKTTLCTYIISVKAEKIKYFSNFLKQIMATATGSCASVLCSMISSKAGVNCQTMSDRSRVMMMYISSVKERCEILANYLVEHHATVRATAKRYGISKSTVHKDVTHNLKQINPSLYTQVLGILEQNKDERHLRGGEATKQKYLQQRKQAENSKKHR